MWTNKCTLLLLAFWWSWKSKWFCWHHTNWIFMNATKMPNIFSGWPHQVIHILLKDFSIPRNLCGALESSTFAFIRTHEALVGEQLFAGREIWVPESSCRLVQWLDKPYSDVFFTLLSLYDFVSPVSCWLCNLGSIWWTSLSGLQEVSSQLLCDGEWDLWRVPPPVSLPGIAWRQKSKDLHDLLCWIYCTG